MSKIGNAFRAIGGAIAPPTKTEAKAVFQQTQESFGAQPNPNPTDPTQPAATPPNGSGGQQIPQRPEDLAKIRTIRRYIATMQNNEGRLKSQQQQAAQQQKQTEQQ